MCVWQAPASRWQAVRSMTRQAAWSADLRITCPHQGYLLDPEDFSANRSEALQDHGLRAERDGKR